MSEFPVFRSEEEIADEEDGEGVVSMDIDLFPGDDPMNKFRLRNNPKAPLQRERLVSRQRGTYVKCNCVAVIHGDWGSGSSDKATLVVLSFRFAPRKPSRRVIWAQMQFTFTSSTNDSDDNPEVKKISLDDVYTLGRTTRTEEKTIGSDGTVGGGAFGLELSSTLKRETKVTQEQTDCIRIVGSTDSEGGSYVENSACWTVSENKSQRSGVPAHLRVGILLRRNNDQDFQSTVEVKTKTDLMSRVEDLFGGRDEDDPILFKASLPPVCALPDLKFDVSDLGSFDLATVEEVIYTTVLEDVTRVVSK